jgi:hypothetical protein
MLTLERSLAALVRAGTVTALEAERYANDPATFADELRRVDQQGP